MNTLILIGVSLSHFSVSRADLQSAFGSAVSMAGPFVPKELRGAVGSVANIALAKKNAKMGIIDLVQDGSDYPFICLCGTTEQLKQLNVNGVNIAANQCPEDITMGCRPAQIDLSGAPMPIPSTSSR